MHQDHIDDFTPCILCGVCEECGCDCDPTPYELSDPEDLPEEAQERARESLRYRR